MFATRDRLGGRAGVVDWAFTDRYGGHSPPPYDTLDLGGRRTGVHAAAVGQNLATVASAFGVAELVTLRQVGGADVVTAADVASGARTADGCVTDRPGVALCVRVADCVPVLLADPDAGLIGVAHAGRQGLYAGVVTGTVERMRKDGAERIHAWVGPSVCGGCYEVPAAMRDDVAARHPSTYACTTWGTPSLDLDAGVRAALSDAGCTVHSHARCTYESADLYSYRRDGDRSGRAAGVIVWHARHDPARHD